MDRVNDNEQYLGNQSPNYSQESFDASSIEIVAANSSSPAEGLEDSITMMSYVQPPAPNEAEIREYSTNIKDGRSGEQSSQVGNVAISNLESRRPAGGNHETLEDSSVQVSSSSQHESPTALQNPLSAGYRQTINTFASNDNLVQAYIRQLLYGCGRNPCRNRYCASNPSISVWDTQDIASLASQLALMRDRWLCDGMEDRLISNSSRETSGHDIANAQEVSVHNRATTSETILEDSNNHQTLCSKDEHNTNGQYSASISPRIVASMSLSPKTLKKVSGLTLEEIEATIMEDSSSKNWENTMIIFKNIFSDPKKLDLALLEDYTISGHLVVQRKWKQIFHIITNHCPRDISSDIMYEISHLLDMCKNYLDECDDDHIMPEKASLSKTSSVKAAELALVALVRVLDHPSMLDSSFHEVVVSKICALIASFQPNTKIAFQKIWAQSKIPVATAEDLEKILKDKKENMEHKKILKDAGGELLGSIAIFQQFLTLRVYKLTHDLETDIDAAENAMINKDMFVQDTSCSLAVFYDINEHFGLVSFEEFYNEAVNEALDIKEDFPHWKAQDGFSFCDFPFILNPASKTNILKVESMVQMRHELQDSFFRAMFIGVNSPYLVLEIRRNFIIRDALTQLEGKNSQDLKKQLKIQFVGEEAVDEGGVQKEFFQLVVRGLFDPIYGIFKKNEESGLFWFSPFLHGENQIDNCKVAEMQGRASLNMNTMNQEEKKTHIEEVGLVGRLIGLAIYNNVILDVHFPTALYKKLSGRPVDLEDLKQLDPALAKSLEMILNYDGNLEDLDRTFQVDIEGVGNAWTVELKPNGESIPLTNENRREFVDLYVDFVLNKSISPLFDSFKAGFDAVCTPEKTAISLFRPEELELLVCGSSELDFAALEKVAKYDGGFEKSTPVVNYFWETVHTWNEKQKKRLLFFTTGTDRVPIGGLGKLNFVIAKNGPNSNRLPSSHTCFNVLLLPEYDSKEKLNERLSTAIQNSEGFGMI